MTSIIITGHGDGRNLRFCRPNGTETVLCGTTPGKYVRIDDGDSYPQLCTGAERLGSTVIWSSLAQFAADLGSGDHDNRPADVLTEAVYETERQNRIRRAGLEDRHSRIVLNGNEDGTRLRFCDGAGTETRLLPAQPGKYLRIDQPNRPQVCLGGGRRGTTLIWSSLKQLATDLGPGGARGVPARILPADAYETERDLRRARALALA